MIVSLFLAISIASDTTTYVVLNHDRPAGQMQVVRDADSVLVTYGHVDRNRGRWVQNRYGLGASGAVVRGESRPMTRAGAVSEATDRYELTGDSVSFRRGPLANTTARAGGFYALSNATAWDQALHVRHLLRSPDRSAATLPMGRAVSLEIAADTMVPTRRGPRRVRLAMMHTFTPTPQGVWVDEAGELVASTVGWFITVHPDYVSALPTLRAVETAYRNAAGASVAQSIPIAAEGSVVIRNAAVFDSERGVVVPRQTIVVQGDRIVEVGDASRVRTPRGAKVIDASGKTVIPGMWDMHSHFQLTSQTTRVLQMLAIGVTTLRDMAADTDVGTAHRDRAARGEIVSPRVILAGFIEGPLQWAGPSDALVSTEADARAWVARYDSLGYKQIKLYNIVHQDIVPTIAAEAKARGMRLSGHVPRGLSVPAAIRLGFDEINHAAFMFSNFHQDSLYIPEMRAYSLVASIVAPNTDVDGPEMTALIAELKAHNTVMDGTFNLWMRDSTGADSASAKAGNRSYLRLVKRLHDAGVTVVPGTDGSSFNAELEHYQQAGIPAAEVLQLATLVSARVMGEDADYGSIAAGKVADLVIIDGKPHENVRDARNVTLVMRGGKAYDPKKITAALSTPLKDLK